MTYVEIINSILEAKTKTGKLIATKPEHLTALKLFRDFDPSKDFVEGKELTKAVKILCSYLYKVFPISVKSIAPDYTGNLRDYQADSLEGIMHPMYISDRFTAQEKEIAEQVDLNKKDLVLPLLVQYRLMDKRRMRNGVLPKEEREKLEKEKIKGNLNPKLREELEKLKVKWRKLIYEYNLDFYKKKREAALVFLNKYGYRKPDYKLPSRDPKRLNETQRKELDILNTYGAYNITYNVLNVDNAGLYSLKTDEELIKQSERIADDEADGWFFKMSDKLGGLVMDFGKELKDVRDASGYKRKASPFDASFFFEFTDGSSFELKNSIVFAHSVNGLPFYRYPGTFHNAYTSKGEKIARPDEHNVKYAFMKDAGMSEMPKKEEKVSRVFYQNTVNFSFPDGTKKTVTLYTRKSKDFFLPKDLIKAARILGLIPSNPEGTRFSFHQWKRVGDSPEGIIENIYKVIEDNKDSGTPKAETGILLPSGKQLEPKDLPAYNKEVGGYLAGIDDKGEVILHDDGETKGGMLIGRRHSDSGGIKAFNHGANQKVLVETGEASIIPSAVLDPTKHEFDGKMCSNREILSMINRSGGGVSFAGEAITISDTGGRHSFDNDEDVSETEIFNRINKSQMKK